MTVPWLRGEFPAELMDTVKRIIKSERGDPRLVDICEVLTLEDH